MLSARALLGPALHGSAAVAITVVDRSHRPIWSNPATELLLGVAPDRVAGALEHPEENEWRFFDADGERFDFRAAEDRCMDLQERFGPELIGVRRPDGSLFWAHTEMVPVPMCDCGSRWCAAIVSVDLTARRFDEQVLRRLAFADPLTGLANRVVLEDRVAQAASQSERRGRCFRLFYFDLDDFKPVNDRYGHETGDAVLRAVAVRLAGAFRSSDTVARIGGDEFAVLAEGAEPQDIIIARVRAAIETPITFLLDGQPTQTTVGVSCGTVRLAGPIDPAGLLREADTAMYRDKRRRATDRKPAG
ncbi:sensor domain-containing diguanylate cyclase [Conexibacter sp. JD483]|uniref:sensor domain-containing diguanylate cyclase n=1 Tax=unclassified Conexibacter TaxID=2627773 RepID=UPI002722D103|nr:MULTISPECIES: sensor domain-containing diguanylate cyclase [unclassified Conexibacter]MDO8183943.1 sensor domain-containing diguanylate cyclase [Conexibacter sp. CPCC 205706]MDO8196935.1 sensor domain-containing diguanylate cyclase [Conexibacter sp. CPCC 205762]MDR9369095.1 sensor domain-containing diguanylate cyclase [Conexibacter sp. JD483]